MMNSTPKTLIARVVCAVLFCGVLATTTIAQTPQPTPIPILNSHESTAKLRQETFESVW